MINKVAYKYVKGRPPTVYCVGDIRTERNAMGYDSIDGQQSTKIVFQCTKKM